MRFTNPYYNGWNETGHRGGGGGTDVCKLFAKLRPLVAVPVGSCVSCFACLHVIFCLVCIDEDCISPAIKKHFQSQLIVVISTVSREEGEVRRIPSAHALVLDKVKAICGGRPTGDIDHLESLEVTVAGYL